MLWWWITTRRMRRDMLRILRKKDQGRVPRLVKEISDCVVSDCVDIVLFLRQLILASFPQRTETSTLVLFHPQDRIKRMERRRCDQVRHEIKERRPDDEVVSPTTTREWLTHETQEKEVDGITWHPLSIHEREEKNLCKERCHYDNVAWEWVKGQTWHGRCFILFSLLK